MGSVLFIREIRGGPQIEILAKKGDPERYDLPKPIFNKGGCNLSFAGLKTSILKICFFMIFVGNREQSIRMLKDINIVAKAKLGTESEKKRGI